MDDIPKIGITGMPSVGKTQTLIKIIEFLEKSGYTVEGMITEPIIEKKKRVGFYVRDWQTNEKQVFAHMDIDSKDKVGKYGVDLNALENIGVPAIEKAIVDEDVNIIIIVLGITTIYFSGSMVRLVLLLAPAAALLSAIAIDKLLYTYSLSAHGKRAFTKRKMRITKSIGRDEAIIAYVVVFGLLVTFAFHSVKQAERYALSEMAPVYIDPPGIPASDWQEALQWLLPKSRLLA